MIWLLITGNPVDGFTYYGPFSDHDEASSLADRCDHSDWWICELVRPDSFDAESGI